MAGPARPQIVLFGSSIFQFSFSGQGWGAILADIYSRKADMLLRGYAGWNSRRAVKVLDQVFPNPKDAAVKPSLVIVYFGGNDSMKPNPSGLGPHVPLPEYKENMKKIASHLKNLSKDIRIIFLTTPPMNEKQMCKTFGVDDEGIRTNEACGIYADACMEVCNEMGIKGVNLWSSFQQKPDWSTTCFTDGVHLAFEGSKIVVKEILRVLREAEWEPSLYWRSMTPEFWEEDADLLPVGPDGKQISRAQIENMRYSEWE